MGKEKEQEQVAGREATGGARTAAPSGRAPAVRSTKATLAFAADVWSVDVPSDTARLQNREGAQRTAGQAGSGTRRLRCVSFCLLDHESYSTANVPAEGFSALRRTTSNGTQERHYRGSGRFDCHRRCLDCVSHSRRTHSTNCTIYITCPNGATVSIPVLAKESSKSPSSPIQESENSWRSGRKRPSCEGNAAISEPGRVPRFVKQPPQMRIRRAANNRRRSRRAVPQGTNISSCNDDRVRRPCGPPGPWHA